METFVIAEISTSSTGERTKSPVDISAGTPIVSLEPDCLPAHFIFPLMLRTFRRLRKLVGRLHLSVVGQEGSEGSRTLYRNAPGECLVRVFRT